MHFTADYVERATLRDGTPIVIRLLTPEDKPLLAAGFASLSDQSRYTRFLSTKLDLEEHELRYLTEIDQQDHFALGAIREDGDGRGAPIGLGIARFIRLADGTSAEAAITVADEAQRKGLGRMLMLRLCAAAAERGIEHFRCEVLGSNAAAIQLLADISPQRTIEISDGVMTIDLPLIPVPPEHPADGPSPEGPLYAMLRAAAANAIEWTESVKRLWRR
jgi:ribosomal protein S18 acetylase RimI-like enzyme